MTSEGELNRRLVTSAAWWRDSNWAANDPDVGPLSTSSFDYEPHVLDNLELGGLYMLLGPRRVGKSVEVKRAIAALIESGVNARRILHFACDGLSPDDIVKLVRTGREQATLSVQEPRYWFLDEITGAQRGWIDTIKWLRDNMAGFKQDCVVLTGSSARDLLAARKAFAGRGGDGTDRERTLLPMNFRDFCAAIGKGPSAPADPVAARDLLTPQAEAAVHDLVPWLDELATAWELYLTIGGFPRAVDSYLKTGEVSPAFILDLWTVLTSELSRDARPGFSETQAESLLAELLARITKPVNLTTLAKKIGVGAHETAQRRLQDLEDAYLLWRCYPSQNGRPQTGAQYKAYFTDPLLAHLANLRNPAISAPASSELSEQAVGFALVRQRERESPRSYTLFNAVMPIRTTSGTEIDFTGPGLGTIAVEGKYVDESIQQESLTLRSQIDNGRLSGGVLATRAIMNMQIAERVWALPASMLVWLLGE